MTSKQLKLDIVSDIICPWCWIGKRNLDIAISRLGPDFNVTVQWHPFLLRPQMPREGVPKLTPAASQPPDDPNNPRVGSRLRSAGAAAGIDFTGKCNTTPNTILGHRLLHYADKSAGNATQHTLQELIFQGYFTDGLVPDISNLVDWADKAGLNKEAVREYLLSDEDEQRVVDEAIMYSQDGVNGVPTFYLNGEELCSGGQSPDFFENALKQAS
ncbi:unnamed protein product [Chrysoparadoxa australica]